MGGSWAHRVVGSTTFGPSQHSIRNGDERHRRLSKPGVATVCESSAKPGRSSLEHPDLHALLEKVFNQSLGARLKALTLGFSFFHHMAFLRSWTLGTHGTINSLNVVGNYHEGRKMILRFGPMLRELVRAGLTIGKIQDYEAAALEQKTAIEIVEPDGWPVGSGRWG